MNVVVVFRVIAFINFAAFTFGVTSVFKKGSELNSGKYRILQLLSLIMWASILYFGGKIATSAFRATIAVVGQVASAFLFWVGIYQIRNRKFALIYTNAKPGSLVLVGLFRYVRHPFYTSYVLNYLSSAAGIQHWMVFFAAVTLTAVYYKAAVLEETRILAGSDGEKYRAYKARTGMFFPKFRLSSKRAA